MSNSEFKGWDDYGLENAIIDGSELFGNGKHSRGYSIKERSAVGMLFGNNAKRNPTGMRNRSGKLEIIGKMISSGKTNAEIVQAIGGDRRTASKLRGIIKAATGKEFYCVCGKPITHANLCAFRYYQTSKWKDFLKKIPEIKKYILEGKRFQFIQDRLHTQRYIVVRVWKLLEKDRGIKIMCACNKPMGHVGLCLTQTKKKNIHGYKGITKRKYKGKIKWSVIVTHRRKASYLGIFSSKESAAFAYNHWAKKVYGDRAILNVIPNWDSYNFVVGNRDGSNAS